MPVGVSEKEFLIIIDILKQYANNYDFYFYGSRVKGNFEKTSDLDILIKGSAEMPFSELEQIKESFDKSLLSYIVNFVDYHKIDEKFYNLIKSNLIKVDF